METLFQRLFPSSLDWFNHFLHNNSTTTFQIMTSILWIVCLTLLFVVVHAEAWLPTGIVKFQQRIRRRSTSTLATSSTDEETEVAEDAEAAERKLLSRLPWWEDSWSEAFMNSFQLSSSSVPARDELSHYETPHPNPSADVLHFCFLLHGHRGFSTDLSYLQRVMQHQAELEKSDQAQTQDMIVHCATCNEGKTMDGVVNGGERMVQEILEVIRGELKRRNDNTEESDIQDITISIVGNSLGGIYGRYAIARLAQKAADEEHHPELSCSVVGGTEDENDCEAVLLDGKYRLHFNIFCTTATPHLGISKHTYVPIPRSVEVGAAQFLGETGKDLFRLNDLMKTMATCPTFLDPLRKFRKRVAYANAFWTDFPVPASTAAFLNEQSTYPHHFADESETNITNAAEDDSDNSTKAKKKHIVATLHTPAAKNPPNTFPGSEEEAIVDDLVQMSYSLDSLGWKKVFIDVRKEIPLRVALPRTMNIRKSLKNSLILAPRRLRKSLTKSGRSRSSGVLNDDAKTELQSTSLSAPVSRSGSTVGFDSGDNDDKSTKSDKKTKKRSNSAIHRLRQKGVVESRDVASAVSSADDNRLSFPLGHNLMVALDRDGVAGGIYKGGRPVMDSLAKELVHDIFDWNFQEESDVEAGALELSGHVDSN